MFVHVYVPFMRIYSLNFVDALGRIPVLEKLLIFRRIFHRLAAEEAVGKSTAVICWVDRILAKLGQVVHQSINFTFEKTPLTSTSFLNAVSCHLSTLGEHRGDTSLRAALQLPHTLPQIVSTIESEYASMAAIRLTVRIMFSMTMLQCPVGIKKGLSIDCAHRALQTFICKRGMELGDLNNFNQALEDRTIIAMALSMFAMLDLSESSEPDTRLRPHTQALMLEQISCVFVRKETDDCELNPIRPFLNLDAAQRLLIDWGVTIPWCWTVWNDERFLDYDVILCLVRFLYGDQSSIILEA
ncbi:hypothetical protein BDY19DRAFT_39080 [Irpex rosettiformis]|uniref:Uncharacterized protein n=1 Tax=Irpex rosettiformis TaxID=378272 RepID=A0ACB8UK56_9APHY|nr:hypothetical protein BDY19DRAFT_39080 [Irpex rosettiformis]